jgi:DinB family protein
MGETVQQYVKRILGYIGDKDPLASQATAPRKLARLIRGIQQKKMRRRPGPGKWSVGEILAHLAETELVGGYRIRMILGKNGTPIQAFEQDAWAREGHYSRRDPQESLELFTALRKGNLALLRSLKRAQWKNYGMHAERGKESVEKIVRMFAGHDINHIRQVERILGRASR